MSNHMPHEKVHLIIYLCSNLSYNLLVKGAPSIFLKCIQRCIQRLYKMMNNRIPSALCVLENIYMCWIPECCERWCFDDKHSQYITGALILFADSYAVEKNGSPPHVTARLRNMSQKFLKFLVVALWRHIALRILAIIDSGNEFSPVRRLATVLTDADLMY